MDNNLPHNGTAGSFQNPGMPSTSPQSNPYGTTQQPAKKKGKKKWIIGGVAAVAVIAIASGTNGGSNDADDPASASADSSNIGAESSVTADDPSPTTSEGDAPREHKNALRSAQNYVDLMPFSKAGLYDQLTSESADQFPADAAQYAVDHVNADWMAEAVEAAESYQELMPMSDAELFEQLTSEFGSKFSAEEAQHAVDSLAG